MTPRSRRGFSINEAILFLLIFATVVALAWSARAQEAPPPFYTYEWPCNGYEYGNAPLIYEAQFPDAHPGLTHLSWLDIKTELVTHRKRRTASVGVTVTLQNRRGAGLAFPLLLFHHVHQISPQTSRHTITFPEPIQLIEGDVVKVGIACTLNGRVPKNRPPRVLYSIDFN